jgi:hypothetical protein
MWLGLRCIVRRLTIGDDLARFKERVRGRVRRGASARHSLLWWWLFENWRKDPDWPALAAEMTAMGVKATPAEVQRMWGMVRDQAPAERERMAKAQADRRHARAWKVDGKLPRNPVDHAKRQARIDRDREQRKARGERRAKLAAALPAPRHGEIAFGVMPVTEPPQPPPPPSPETQAAIQAVMGQFRQIGRAHDRAEPAQAQPPAAQEAGDEFRQAEVARQGRGLLARLRAAWRGSRHGT